LLCEAIDYAGEYVAAKIERADNGLAALDGLVAYYRKELLSSDYRAGCPVVAVTVEAGDPAKQDQSKPVIDRAAAAFTRWTDLIAQRLVADGVSTKRASELAMLCTTAIEGALIVARASRELEPLESVHGQLRDLLQAEVSERKSSDGR
jgi:hypothetical protein